MGVMSPKLLEEQRKYKTDLRWRVLKAPCPRCKAKPGSPCQGPRRPIADYHAVRGDEAKRLGFVMGRRITAGPPPEPLAGQQGSRKRAKR
jgi:hypothetical protein